MTAILERRPWLVSPEALTRSYVEFQAFERPSDERVAAFVKESAAVLEFLLVVAVTFETLEEMGVEDLSQLGPRNDEVLLRVGQVARIDPDGVINTLMVAAPKFWKGITSAADLAGSPEPPPFGDLVQAMRAMVAACPIDRIEELAIPVGQHEWGHRARMAYEAINGFVRRHDAGFDGVLREAGKLYASGRLSLEEAARLIPLHPSDAIATFEEHGFCRPADREIFAPGERAAKLAQIRDERLARQGRPAPTAERIYRDTVASCRIESLDARRWLDRE